MGRSCWRQRKINYEMTNLAMNLCGSKIVSWRPRCLHWPPGTAAWPACGSPHNWWGHWRSWGGQVLEPPPYLEVNMERPNARLSPDLRTYFKCSVLVVSQNAAAASSWFCCTRAAALLRPLSAAIQPPSSSSYSTPSLLLTTKLSEKGSGFLARKVTEKCYRPLFSSVNMILDGVCYKRWLDCCLNFTLLKNECK